MVLVGTLLGIFTGAVIYGSMTWLLHLADSEKTAPGIKSKRNLPVGLALGNAVVVTAVCELERKLGAFAGEYLSFRMGAEGILLSLLAGGLLAAACMDAENCYVYNYVWWWCLLWTGILSVFPAGGQYTDGGLWRSTDGICIRQAAAVLVFIALQQCLFARMYGRADSHAFSVCALISCRWRAGMLWFLIHMLSAVTLLAVIQLWKGNVTRGGKLRTPKPFIPYIIITFWGEILWTLCLRGGLTHIYA